MQEMPQFAAGSVSELLDALASPTPTPGGGTAAAIAGAMGASLLVMVAGLTKTRTGADVERLPLVLAGSALTPIRRRLARLADEDSAAFDEVMAAYRLPKGSEEQQAARMVAIQAALQRASTVPLDTLRACAEALEHAEAVARCGNTSAACDVGVAVGLLEAAAAGADANVRINLDGLRDQAEVARLRDEAERLAARARAAGAAARQALVA